MRPYLTFLSAFLLCGLHAQLDVPVRLALDGAEIVDRQISGLADPMTGDAAVSVDAARAGSMSFTPLSGSSALIGELFPTPTAYTPGMSITVVPSEANAAGATLELNGLGIRPIVKWGQVALDSADMPVGEPARLVYDGSRFLLLSHAARPCPPNFSPGGSTYCVSDSVTGAGTFYEGIAACEALGGRLCTFGEWSNACLERPGFLATVNNYEWVDDAHNNNNDAKTVGAGYAGPLLMEGYACEYGLSRAPTVISNYRCCTSR